MNKVKNIDIVEKEMGSWSPENLAYIKKFKYISSYEQEESKIVISGVMQLRDLDNSEWPSDKLPFYEIELEFISISNLKLNDFTNDKTQIMGFEIFNIEDKNWENLIYHISDYEEGKIDFYCRDVSVLSIKKIQ